MKGWGMFLIVVGIFCIFSAIGMDTSVETGLGGRVNNLGLMNIQTNLIIGGGISFISGILLVGFSSKSDVNSSEQTRVCPYCAEIIKSEARVCRYCGKDIPEATPKQSSEKKSSSSSLAKENYISVEAFSKHKNIDEAKVIEMVKEGFYNGHIFDGQWYVHKSELT